MHNFETVVCTIFESRYHEFESRAHHFQSRARQFLSHAHQFKSHAHKFESSVHDLKSRAHGIKSSGNKNIYIYMTLKGLNYYALLYWLYYQLQMFLLTSAFDLIVSVCERWMQLWCMSVMYVSTDLAAGSQIWPR